MYVFFFSDGCLSSSSNNFSSSSTSSMIVSVSIKLNPIFFNSFFFFPVCSAPSNGFCLDCCITAFFNTAFFISLKLFNFSAIPLFALNFESISIAKLTLAWISFNSFSYDNWILSSRSLLLNTCLQYFKIADFSFCITS